MKLERLDQARFPMHPAPGFADRVLSAARREPRPQRPTFIPELLDGIGWAAALWVGGVIILQFL